MTTEQRNKVINELLMKCCFIGSKTIKITEQDVAALKECYLEARRWNKIKEAPEGSMIECDLKRLIEDIEQEVQ